jgi:hypothetical protein
VPPAVISCNVEARVRPATRNDENKTGQENILTRSISLLSARTMQRWSCFNSPSKSRALSA